MPNDLTELRQNVSADLGAAILQPPNPAGKPGLMSAILVKSATTDQILSLRHRVLRTGLPLETARFDGDDDPATIQLAAAVEDHIVGCVTIMPRPYAGRPGWQLRGMAVDPGWQDRGIGRRLLVEGQRRVQSAGPGLLWCNARVTAIGFYRRHGWRVDSEPFDVPSAGPHVKMCIDLP